MIAEISRLDPKPGRGFGAAPEPPAIPDVFVTAAPDSSWRIELNSDALPRVLVNETYAAQIKRGAAREEDRQYHLRQFADRELADQEPRAARAHDPQRRLRDRAPPGQLSHRRRGRPRPLNLKAVADAIGVHESTVSRATSNKFIQTPRGLFEMKYFFTTSIASVANGPAQAHSAESVRYQASSR